MTQPSTTYCRFLRGKNAYGTLEGGDQPVIEVDSGTTTYWCIRTQGPVGPDDGMVHISTCCKPERKCFAPPQDEQE